MISIMPLSYYVIVLTVILNPNSKFSIKKINQKRKLKSLLSLTLTLILKIN